MSSYAMRGAHEDTLSSLQRGQVERERLHQYNERVAAIAVIDWFCEAKGLTEEDRQTILAALGLDEK